jgi:hypothetical protein
MHSDHLLPATTPRKLAQGRRFLRLLLSSATMMVTVGPRPNTTRHTSAGNMPANKRRGISAASAARHLIVQAAWLFMATSIVIYNVCHRDWVHTSLSLTAVPFQRTNASSRDVVVDLMSSLTCAGTSVTIRRLLGMLWHRLTFTPSPPAQGLCLR